MRSAAFALVLLALALAPLASAHGGAALPGDSLERATRLGGPPARVFEALDGGAPHFYRFTPSEGDLRLRVLLPDDGEPRVDVLVALYAVGLADGVAPRPEMAGPNGTGVLSFIARDGEVEVDARIPARFVVALDRTIAVSGTEHVLVVMTETPARVALELTAGPTPFLDPFVAPAFRAEAREWAGVAPWVAYLAGISALAPLALLARSAPRGHWSMLRLCAWVGAGFVAASLAILALDAARTRILPAWSLAAGVASLALLLSGGWRAGPSTLRQRAILLLAAVLALAGWMGLLWGPVAALAGALFPEPAEKKA